MAHYLGGESRLMPSLDRHNISYLVRERIILNEEFFDHWAVKKTLEENPQFSKKSQIRAIVSHGDEAHKLMQKGKLLGSSENTPIEIFSLD